MTRQQRDDRPRPGVLDGADLIAALKRVQPVVGDTGRQLGLVIADLDELNEVAKGLGAEVADRVSRETVRRLARTTRQSDLVGRVAADRFVVVLVDAGDHEDCAAIAERIRRAITKPMRVGPRQVVCGATVRLVMPVDSTVNVVELVQAKDVLTRPVMPG